MNAFSSPIEPAFGGRQPFWGPQRHAGLDDDQGTIEVDVRAIWTTLYRNRMIIAGAMVLTTLLGVASILLTTPTYRASSSVQIDAQSAKVLDTDDLEPLVAGAETERFIRTQMDIVRSRSLAESVAQAIRLYADSDFVPAGSDGLVDHRQAVIDTLQKRLYVEMLPNSRLVRISVKDTDPARAARIANAFADQLIKSNLQRRYATSAYSRQFLSGQLTEAKRKLEDSERSLIAYARAAHLIDASAGATRQNDVGTKSLTTANLVDLNDAYATARAARIKAQQRWNQAQGVSVMSLPETLGNPTIQSLTERRAELEAQYDEEREHRKADHPVVRQLDAKIAEINQQISGLAGNIRSSIRDDYRVAMQQEAALSGDVSSLKEATLAEQDRSVQYNILKRDADTSRQMYDALLQRYKEISAAAGIANNNIASIDQAETPDRPIAPNPYVNIGAAMLAGLALALLVVFGRERFTDRIRDPEDLDRKLKLPLLGVIATTPKKSSPQEALTDPRSGFSEAHNSLCTALEFSSTAGLPRSIMMTSTLPSEGKSTTALALAVSLAREGRRVVLVDADLRRPSLHKTLGISNRVGLVHLLTRNKPLGEVVRSTSHENLWFVPSGPVPPSPTALLAPGVLAALLDEFGQAFDAIIIDAPPVLGLADAPRLSSIAAATVFVLEANGAQARMAERSLKRLISSRANVIGAVLTKFTSTGPYASEYDYGYAYHPTEIETDADEHIDKPRAPAMGQDADLVPQP